MSKTDRAHMEGIAVAKSIDGEIVGKDGRPRREIREGAGYVPANPLPREPAPWLVRQPETAREDQERFRPSEAEPLSGSWTSSVAMPSSSLPKPNIDMPRADPSNQEVNGLHRDPGHSEREVDLREREWEEKARGTWHERGDASHGKEPQPQPPEAEISRPKEGHGNGEALVKAVASAIEDAPRVEAMLLSSSSTGNVKAQLPILLASDLLFQTLVPSGYLQDLSQRCQVHIDITAEESLPSSVRQVVLSGTAASNASAAYWLQVGAARHMVKSAGVRPN
ncbi:unnamed protein product [Effrenium voratum]|uniref:Uncharacterized protein n=1 Tax=Effrenium voratum TaxID=2562239 RepID=A0AA36JCK8_9DINO|nr:unnamed protein product [Effrenium voratum]